MVFLDANVISILFVLVTIIIAYYTIFGLNYQYKENNIPYFFGHQVSISSHRDPNINSKGDTYKKEQIHIFLQVCATNDTGLKTVLGYGSFSLPLLECGSYGFNIQTCKLIASPLQSKWNELLYRLNDYYFGCTLCGFSQMKVLLTNPTNFKDRNNSSQKFRDEVISEPSGTVQINASVLTKFANHSNDRSKNDRVRHMLDEVLSKVRRHKRSGHHHSVQRYSSMEREKSLNEATKKLLLRVKARKEARNHK